MLAARSIGLDRAQLLKPGNHSRDRQGKLLIAMELLHGREDVLGHIPLTRQSGWDSCSLQNNPHARYCVRVVEYPPLPDTFVKERECTGRSRSARFFSDTTHVAYLTHPPCFPRRYYVFLPAKPEAIPQPPERRRKPHLLPSRSKERGGRLLKMPHDLEGYPQRFLSHACDVV